MILPVAKPMGQSLTSAGARIASGRVRSLGRRLCAVGVLAWIAGAPASAQTYEPPETRLVLHAVRTAEPISIDGQLDEPAWSTADVVSGFRQIEPNQGQAARFGTVVRLLYDDARLYIGALLSDSTDLAGRVRGLRRDFDWDTNDAFGVTLDAFGDGRVGMAFQSNRAGVQRDQLVFDGQTYDLVWDGVWSVRTAEVADGWSVEMAIPWATLRYPPGGADWRVNFVRTVRGVGEMSGWSAWPRAFGPYRLEYGGDLVGLEPPPPTANLRVQPYTTGSGLARRDATDAGWVTTTDGDAGADLKWAITPQAVLDLTINTDFAQADVDRQVINLSRFSVFFPERRPFFQENASLFAVGRGAALQPFFSRRVGLDDQGLPIPIHAGARLTTRSAGRQLGALLVHQGGAGAVSGSTIGVARYSRNIGAESRIGALITARQDQGRDTARSVSNAVAAVDAFLRFTPSAYLQGMVSASASSGSGGEDAAGYVWLANRSNRGYIGWVEEYVGRSYAADVGFVRRQDYLWSSPAAWLDYRPDWKPSFVRSFEPGTYAGVYHRASDRHFLEAEWHIYPVYVRLHNNATFRVSAWLHWQDHEQTFTPLPAVDIAPGRYSYNRWAAHLSAPPSARLTASIDASTGEFYDGRMHQLSVAAAAVPSPNAALHLNYTLNALRDVGVVDTDLDAWILAPELRLALDPRVQLSTFYQYSSTDELTTWNARFSWEFRPLSYIYVVYNDRAFDTIDGIRAAPAERQLIVKFTYLQQF